MHVGLIGAGRIGLVHARALARDARVSRVSVTDVDADAAARCAMQLGDRGTVVASAHELLTLTLDAVVIAAPTPLHAPLVIEAARLAVPTLCEKPIAMDADEARQALGAVAEAGGILQVGFQRRFDPAFAELRARIADGSVGRLLHLRSCTFDPAPPPPEYVAVSGGAFRDMHIHDFDAVLWACGRPVVEVCALGSVLVADWIGELDDVDTTAVLLRFDDGSIATIAGSRHDARGYDARLEVLGTRDSLVAGIDPRSALTVVDTDTALREGHPGFLERFADAYELQMQSFLDVVSGAPQLGCTGREALAGMLVADAADESWRTGRPVAVAVPT